MAQPQDGTSSFYMYTDKKGVTHFAEKISEIPKRYRKRAKEVEVPHLAEPTEEPGKEGESSGDLEAGVEAENLQGAGPGQPFGPETVMMLTDVLKSGKMHAVTYGIGVGSGLGLAIWLFLMWHFRKVWQTVIVVASVGALILAGAGWFAWDRVQDPPQHESTQEQEADKAAKEPEKQKSKTGLLVPIEKARNAAQQAEQVNKALEEIEYR